MSKSKDKRLTETIKKIRKPNAYIIKTLLDAIEKTNPISTLELAHKTKLYLRTVDTWIGFFIQIQKFPRISIENIPHSPKEISVVRIEKKES